MGYLNQIDPWLEDQLRLVAEAEDVEAAVADVKREIKGKILESYRNGQGAQEKRASGEYSKKRKYTKKYTKPRR